MMLPRISSDPVIQAEYEAMRAAGESHKLAELLAMGPRGHLPSLMTDAVFNESRCNGNQFEKAPLVGDYYAGIAREAGVDITGRYYMNGLASFPGDPEAWVSGRGDVERVIRERNWSCQGSLNIKGDRDDPGPADVGVAEDLVQSALEARIAADPSLALKDPLEAMEETREMIQPHWA